MKKFNNLFINNDWLVTELAIYSRYKPEDYAPISTLVDIEHSRVKSIMRFADDPFYHDKFESFMEAFKFAVKYFNLTLPEKQIVTYTIECAHQLIDYNISKEIADPNKPVYFENLKFKALKVDQIIWPHY